MDRDKVLRLLSEVKERLEEIGEELKKGAAVEAERVITVEDIEPVVVEGESSYEVLGDTE